MCVYTKGIIAEQKSYGFKNLVKLGVENFFFKIPIGRTVFIFSCKTSRFCPSGCSFWYLFCHFFLNEPILPRGERAKRASLTRSAPASFTRIRCRPPTA